LTKKEGSKMPPEVSVILSVYNGEEYLAEAIESILNQTLSDLEFIIIDDGSTDASAHIIQSYTDPRIAFHPNQKNVGLTISKNRALALAKGRYVAFTDADDISMPGRLAAQFAYLEKHPGVGALGTAAKLIDGQGNVGRTIQFPRHHHLLYWRLLFFNNPLIHPSVMMRTALLTKAGGYDEARLVSQDYELWSRLALTTRLENLPDAYIYLRKHAQNISVLKEPRQFEYAVQLCQTMYLDRFGISLEKQTVEAFAAFYRRGAAPEARERLELAQTVLAIGDAFLQDEDLTWMDKRRLALEVRQSIKRLIHIGNEDATQRELKGFLAAFDRNYAQYILLNRFK
jgi:glycosyltransferase involved in cell wall biosynthesis